MDAERIKVLPPVRAIIKPKPYGPYRFPFDLPTELVLPCGFVWGHLYYGDQLRRLTRTDKSDCRDGTVHIRGSDRTHFAIPFTLSTEQQSPETFLQDGIEETVVREIATLVVEAIEQYEMQTPMLGEHDYERPTVVSVDFVSGPGNSPSPKLERLVGNTYFIEYTPKPISTFDPDQTGEST
jgi:hypothetical protein